MGSFLEQRWRSRLNDIKLLLHDKALRTYKKVAVMWRERGREGGKGGKGGKGGEGGREGGEGGKGGREEREGREGGRVELGK